MPERNWRLFAEDILESIELIGKYVEGMEFDDFKQDRKTIDAVARNFEIIGEASKYIPEDIKEKYHNVDWRGIVGFRDRIIHAYFGMSLVVVWHIIRQELPGLRDHMERILEGV